MSEQNGHALVLVVEPTEKQKLQEAEREGDIPDKTFDGLLVNHIGQFGRYQGFLFVSLSLVSAVVIWHNLIHVFTGAVPGFTCIATANQRRDPNSWRGNDYLNTSGLEDETLPPTDLIFYDDSCWLSNNGSDEDDIESCTEWLYDTSQYGSSIVTEWNLVCSQKWLVSFVQSLHMMGCMAGSIAFGALSDRYGRRTVLLASSLLVAVVGISTTFCSNFPLYACLRFLVGMGVAAQFNCAYIIAMELVGPKWRGLAGMGMMCITSLSIMVMSGMAYALREWRHLQFATSAPAVIFLMYFFIAPESPRWLLTHSKFKTARRLIDKMAKYNGRTLPADYIQWLTREKEEKCVEKEHSILDIVRYPRIRIRTLTLWFMWFTVSVTYYGLCLYTSNLGGNDYINFFLSGAVELPAYAFGSWCLCRFGRRLPLGISMALSGVFLLLTSPLSQDQAVIRVVLSMMGKMCISVSFVISYPFSAEMFPTVVRSNGLGFVTTGARVGGFMAPYILLLGEFNTAMPLIVCGAFAFFGGIFAMMLPETQGKELPETIEDGERMKNNSLRNMLTKMCNREKDKAEGDKVIEEKQIESLLSSKVSIKA